MSIAITLLGGAREGRFRSDDVALATNPRTREKAARLWRHSVADVDLYLLNDTQGIWTAARRWDELMRSIQMAGCMPKAAAAYLGVPVRPEALSIILTTNEGTARLPLTGWMIAHRLFHALEYAGMTTVWNYYDHKPIENAFDVIVSIFADLRRFCLDGLAMTKTDFYGIGTSRACRTGNLSNPGELIAEGFAQYVLTGHLVLRRFTPAQAARYEISPTSLDQVNQRIDDLQRVMEKHFQAMLDYVKGKAVIL
jgi:hypothetical protein